MSTFKKLIIYDMASLTKFFNDGGVWYLGGKEAVQAEGWGMNAIGADGLVTITDAHSIRINAQHWSKFCNKAGVAYASLDAFRAVANDFFLSETSLLGASLGRHGDFPIQGTVKVVAPTGFYFWSANVIVDATMTAMEVDGVAYTGDSYLNKVLPVTWHPFTVKVTAITLSSGELQAWLKPL